MDDHQHLEHTTAIVAAFVSNNAMPAADLPRLIASVGAALIGLGKPPVASVETKPLVPAVPVAKSITPDAIICLDDGKKFRSLKRHLGTLGMTPAMYREKWNLPADYPMAAPNYSAVRSNLAKAIGLGTTKPDLKIVEAA